jgi:hypothetical protein
MSHPRLPFLDSFDHYLTAHRTRKWTMGCGDIVAGRHGNGTRSGKTAFALDYKSMAAGCAYKTTGFSNSPIKFQSGWESLQNVIDLAHMGDGRLRVYAPDPANKTSAPSDFVMNPSEFYYLELKAEISAVKENGKFDVDYEARVNEETIISGTWTDIPWANGSMNILTLQSPGGGSSCVFDDVYATEGEFLGDIRIGVIRPNGAGFYSDWTAQPAGDHYDLVNDQSPDDDSTYLQAAEAALVETHEYEDIAVYGEIRAIQTLVCVKKSDAGTAATKSRLRSGEGDEVQGLIFYPSETSYLYDRTGYVLNPWTGLAWTEDQINSLQFGLSREE